MAELNVEEFVAGYCEQAGIKSPAAEADGTYLLRFDGKYAVQFGSDGRNSLLLRHDFKPLDRDRTRQEAMQRLLRINLALAGRKRSTLTIDSASGKPFLYDLIPADSADESAGFKKITGFVNEIAAFHKALDRI
jgi:hypothetical protein